MGTSDKSIGVAGVVVEIVGKTPSESDVVVTGAVETATGNEPAGLGGAGGPLIEEVVDDGFGNMLDGLEALGTRKQ